MCWGRKGVVHEAGMSMHDADIWQTLRREVGGRLVAQQRDEWGWLHVVDHEDCRYLYFGAPYEQSCILRAKPWRLVHEYARAMMLGAAFSAPHDILMLGLGGGSLAHAIRRGCPQANLTVVELRPAVAAIARDYFQLDFLPDDQLIMGDARQRLREFPPHSCDLLLADLFFDDRMHPLQAQHKFFQRCRDLLRPEGWLVVNFDAPRIDSGGCQSLFDLFPTMLSLTTRDDNQIVLASLDSTVDPLQAAPAVERLGQQLEVPLLPLLAQMRQHT